MERIEGERVKGGRKETKETGRDRLRGDIEDERE